MSPGVFREQRKMAFLGKFTFVSVPVSTRTGQQRPLKGCSVPPPMSMTEELALHAHSIVFLWLLGQSVLGFL